MNDLQRFATNLMEVFRTSPNPRRDLGDALFVRQARTMWDNVDDIINLVEQKAFVTYKAKHFQLNYMTLIEYEYGSGAYWFYNGRGTFREDMWEDTEPNWKEYVYNMARQLLPGWNVERIELKRWVIPIDILMESARHEFYLSDRIVDRKGLPSIHDSEWKEEDTFLYARERAGGRDELVWQAVDQHFEMVGNWLYKLRRRERDSPYVRWEIFHDGPSPYRDFTPRKEMVRCH